jgi:hypothetical protein
MREILGQASENFVVEALALGHEDVQAAAIRAIDKSKKWNQRDCPLKPTLIVWLIILLSPFRNLSIPNVFKRMLSIIRVSEPELSLNAVTPEALHHARRRLGNEPMELLFQELAKSGTKRTIFHGFRVIGGDGCLFRMPDTPANEKKFGRKKGGRGQSGYPQLRAVTLVDSWSRKVVDAVFQGCNDSERAGLEELVVRSLGTGDLLLVDRGLASYRIFHLCRSLDASWLARIPAMWKPEVLERYSDGDYIVKVRPCRVEQEKMRKLGLDPKDEMRLRMISYKVSEGEIVRLLTNLTDPKYTGRELALLYHQRWEAELAYDELKTHFAAVANGKQPTHFRSKKPEGVLQEAYGMLVAYNLIRNLIASAAEKHQLSPVTISFVDTLELVKVWLPALARKPAHKWHALRKQMLEDIAECRLRPRRPRACPRKIKIKMSSYHLKRPEDRELRLDFAAELKLTEP